MSYAKEKQNILRNYHLASFNQVAWNIVDSEDEEETNFGNAFVCFDNGFFRLRFLRELGTEFVDMGPSQNQPKYDEEPPLFPVEMVAAVLQGSAAVDQYIAGIEEKWQEHPFSWIDQSQNTDNAMSFIASNWDALVDMFRENSLTSILSAQKRSQELNLARLEQNSQQKNPSFIENRIAWLANRLSKEELNQLINVVSEDDQKQLLEHIRHKIAKDREMDQGFER